MSVHPPPPGEQVPFGFVTVDPEGPDKTVKPLIERLFVGRECIGVDDQHKILLQGDPAISRNHFEIRIDPETSHAVVVDTSSNGVRLNGVRIERAAPVPLSDGDEIQVGSRKLHFSLHRQGATVRPERHAELSTFTASTAMTMVMIVGDLINYSTVSEQVDPDTLARSIHVLYQRLRQLLTEHRGTLVDYVGDAFFASWELDSDPVAVDHALSFALAAEVVVRECTPSLDIHYADGTPMGMGWAATLGPVMMSLMPGSVVMVIGDAVNVGFRIAALAGRQGRPSVLAAQSVRDAAGTSFSFGTGETVLVKGRVGEETIYGVSRA
jgi:adenylate cyclase